MKKRMIPLALSAIIALSAQSYAKSVELDIASQPLSSALSKLAEQSGMSLLVSQDVVAGKTAPALKGAMEPSAALAKLLAGTDLEASTKDGTITVRKAEGASEQSLEKITLAGTQEAVVKPKEGSAEAGYKVDTVKNVGPWGEKKLLDTPYSINVISSDLVSNINTYDASELFRVTPSVQILSPKSSGATDIELRGFRQYPVNGNQALDGNRNYDLAMALEDKERVEILTGSSGFIYGVANPGGTVNYVLKRPTITPYHELTVGNYGGDQYYAHMDISAPIDQDGKFAYRLNAVVQNGDTELTNQSIERNLISGAFDWHITDRLLLQLDAAHSYYKVNAPTLSFSYASNVDIANISSNTANAAPEWAFDKMVTDEGGARIQWKINDTFSLRSSYTYAKHERENIFMGANIINSAGDYTISYCGTNAPFYNYNKTFYTYLDSSFETAGIKHKTNIGISTDWISWYSAPDGGSYPGLSGTYNLNEVNNAAKPSFGVYNTLPLRKYMDTKNVKLSIGDEIIFNQQFSALVGLAKNKIDSSSIWNAVDYEKTKIVPNLSLVYKPISYISTYATYIQGLEEGDVVGTLDWGHGGQTITNQNTTMKPKISEEYEVGVKSEIGGMLLSAALFQIEKSNQYAKDNGDGTSTYVDDGLQTHKGIEITATGKAMQNLTLMGGYSYIDATLKKQEDNTALEGKTPTNIPNQMFKLYAEYEIPEIVGLTLTGGVYYIGEQYADDLNQYKLNDYVTEDIGLRYTTSFYSNKATFKMMVKNLTDEKYWLNSQIVGSPRTVAFSAGLQF
ncbi:TonB-dependent receptor [uncultured Sulfuricurvum sp.]|uniref:TonB-dependent siderophore receptor n=1 Tax=uncultured Sulfuricurvum sp. TaxID=430693 RepID=UPI002615712E|nr:TonB-dependent receptor [uncultured Sulfuricurvum sp.]